MRVWILENTPNHEQATRHGVFSTPVAAWDTLFDLVDKNAFQHDQPIKIYVGADQSADPNDLGRPIVLVVTYGWDDEITLSGETVKGTDVSAPTVAEWRDLQQVGGLLRAHAVQVADFWLESTDTHTATGTWEFKKGNLPF